MAFSFFPLYFPVLVSCQRTWLSVTGALAACALTSEWIPPSGAVPPAAWEPSIFFSPSLLDLPGSVFALHYPTCVALSSSCGASSFLICNGSDTTPSLAWCKGMTMCKFLALTSVVEVPRGFDRCSLVVYRALRNPWSTVPWALAVRRALLWHYSAIFCDVTPCILDKSSALGIYLASVSS